MTVQMTRRQFFKLTGVGVASTGIAALGLTPEAVQAATRPFKLERTTEARNICPYCSVSCGLLMYSTGDKAKNVLSQVIHIEGDPDNPVNRGTLCPKGAGLLDMIHSPNRLKYPEVREAGTNEWKRISWEEAYERIAKHMKADRDANFQTTNAEGVTVNRWTSMGFLASSSSSNETGFLTQKVLRSWGAVAIDTQARI
ncbi:MAG: hypothetical protein RLZZ422_1889 [Pseudomonadota bacterium]